MWPTFAYNINFRLQRLAQLACVILCLLRQIDAEEHREGDPCNIKSFPGTCKPISQCSILATGLKKGLFKEEDVPPCGFDVFQEMICCPNNLNSDNTRLVPRRISRPAEVACEAIDSGLGASLVTHIIGGTNVTLGEFPHMAAIGYVYLSKPPADYIIGCGGTLIEKNFVLTAAHCVNHEDFRPKIVRLGVTNFTDVVQMRDAVEINIERIFIHDNFTFGKLYDDIALLKLERDAPYSNAIYPTCLYTEETDPPSDKELFVTGWGYTDPRAWKTSDVLLKAKLQVHPLDMCNATYEQMGFNKRVKEGLVDTQLCAYDPDNRKDACVSDSGGPLNMVVDDTINKYRVIAIVSAGYSCNSGSPGLYTRVAAYLDYIESIVWPSTE